MSREIAEHLKLLVDTSPDCFIFKDGEGRWLEANMAAVDLFRLHDVDYKGKNNQELAGLVDSVFREAFLTCERTDREAWEKGTASRSEEVITLPGGGSRVLEVIKLPFFYKDGSRKGLSVLARDITGLKEMERQVEESTIFLRGILNGIQDGIMVLDREARILMVNQAMERLHQDRLPLLGKKCYEAINLQTEPCSPCPALLTIEDGRLHSEEVTVTDAEGRMRHMELFSYPIVRKGWEISGAIVSVKDVTGKKKAEEAERRLAAAVHQAADSIVITDTDGNIEYVNPAFEKVTGYTIDEALGKNPCILKSGRQNESFYRELWETITRGEVWQGRFENRKKDGTIFEEEATISPVKDASGKIVSYVAVKHDVTRERALQRQLLAAQRMEAVGILAGGVAHDFNNILAAIQGYAELSLLRLDRASPLYAKITQILQASERAAGIVRQLLLFSRRQPMEFVTVDLTRLVTDLLKMLTRLIGEDIAIKTDLYPGILSIHADPGNIEQVIMNIVVNARDALPHGGTITIQTSKVDVGETYCTQYPFARQGSFVRLSISDTGTGIDEETLTHIFEPFFTTKGAGKGTGLGLAVVYGIVKTHKGWITVESSQGKGTTFEVFLPLVGGKEEAVDRDSKPDLSILEGRGQTILAVEDEENVRNFIEEALTNAGYLVLKAETAEEAHRILEKDAERVGLILSDVVLPDVSGIRLVDGLLSLKPGIPVIMSSGYTDERSHRTVILERGWAFLQKPYSVMTLLRTVRDVIAKSQASPRESCGCKPAGIA